MLRTKGGEHNSYNLTDAINQIDWIKKAQNTAVTEYYKKLIALRKNHPAFYMPSAEMVRKHLSFSDAEKGVVAYTIGDNANGDSWKNILVIYNGNKTAINFLISGDWEVVTKGREIDEAGLGRISETVTVPGLSMLIAHQK